MRGTRTRVSIGVSATMVGTKDLRPRCLSLGFLLVTLNVFHVVLSQENVTHASTQVTPTTSGQTNSTEAMMTSRHVVANNISTDTQTVLTTEITTEVDNTAELSNENVTNASTQATPTTSSQTNSTDAVMTSWHVVANNFSTETATDVVTEITAAMNNATMLLNDLLTTNGTSTEAVFSENVTSTTEVKGDPDNEVNTTTESMPSNAQTTTEEYTNASTGVSYYETLAYENETLLANYTQAPPRNETATTLMTTPEQTQRTLTNASRPKTFIIPILIFAGLIFLLTIMIFIAIFTKSRMKKSISTYNLTPAANSNSTSVGFRNTAYDHGDLADDTDRECSMREMRLEGKANANGNAVQKYGGLEEDLTRL